MLNIIFYVFAAVVAIQLFYYLGIFSKFAFAKPQPVNPKRIPISVILWAKNEAEKLKSLIPVLATQNYPDYEIVVIDDASTDDSRDILEAFEKQYPHLRLVKVENNEAFWANKKYALTLGIKASKKEYLLFTDADCYPSSANWILSMSSQFTLNKTIILGYSGYERAKNSLANIFVRFDAVVNAAQYFGWAKAGHPYMATGRNMAYKKEEFFKMNGFISHMNIRGGDDVLFINQAARKKNTTICYNPESFTYRGDKPKFKEWFLQKRKQAFFTRFYKPFDKFHLRVFFIAQLLFPLLAILLAILQFNWMVLVPVIVFRYIIAWVVFGYSAARLREKDVVYWYPFMELFLIFTQLNIFFTNLFSKPVHWK